MSITLAVNGIRYDGFTYVQVKRSFSNIASGFSFQTVSSQMQAFPLKIGDKCVIYVQNTPVCTGFIETLEIDYGTDKHTITLGGRDRTCDLIDSTIGSKTIFTAPITLKQVLERSIKKLGITDIKVIDTVNVKPYSSQEIQSAKIGTTYFTFFDTLCKMRQVLITTDGYGNAVIARSSTQQIKTVLSCHLNDPNNNIKSSRSTFDDTKRFNTYTGYSQGNAVAFIDAPATPQQLAGMKGETASDSEVRATRQYNFIAEKSSGGKDLKDRASWEANNRRASSRLYTCAVEGHLATRDNIIWAPNLLVQVNDDFAQTNGLFLIKDVTYTLSPEPTGSRTELSLVVNDAFTLQAEQDARNAKVNTQGKGFIV